MRLRPSCSMLREREVCMAREADRSNRLMAMVITLGAQGLSRLLLVGCLRHAKGPAGTDTGVPPPARASSLSASVVRLVVPPSQPWAVGASEADELHVGLRYVRALGEDAREGSGSFSSLESSSRPARSSLGSGGAGAGAGAEVLRVLVRVGERFRFRLPVRVSAGATGAGGFTARRVTGELLPAFLYADLEVARGITKSTEILSSFGACREQRISGTCMWGCMRLMGCV